jgi:signal transduction histidine kinase
MAPVSFRAKVLLIYTACALSVVFAVFVAGSYYVNRLQKGNVQAALAWAQEQAHGMAREILEMASQQGTSDLNQPAMKAGIKAMTRVAITSSDNVVWAAVIDSEGNVATEQTPPGDPAGVEVQGYGPSAKKSVSVLHPRTGQELKVETQSIAPGVHEVSEPLVHEGKTFGRVVMHVADNPTFQRIRASSKSITQWLFIGCVFMLFLLLLVFWVLYRMFARQVHLVEKNARLDRMAYVGTLASGLAHEIRNPLHAMSINLEVMREELADVTAESDTPQRASELATRVQREVLQLNSTLTSFLDFALPSKEGMIEFSLRGLIDELVELHAEELRHAGITFEVSGPQDDSVLVEADRRLVHQAFRNILVNAIQVLQGAVKKQIRIKVDPAGQHDVVVTVSDTGPGITPENLGRIFEVFFSTRKGGSGFGLAITKKIIEEHGGSITADNNSQALGATFTVRLPKHVPGGNGGFSLRRGLRMMAPPRPISS